jgi:hypothetical protein
MKLLAAAVVWLSCMPLAHASAETDACDTRRQLLEQQMATALDQAGSPQRPRAEKRHGPAEYRCMGAKGQACTRYAGSRAEHTGSIDGHYRALI